MIGAVVVGVTAITLLILLLPHMRNSDNWMAMLTPLASIIGSGFLVSAPLLGRIAGNAAIFAMAALCGIGLMLGAVIRFNIAHVEPALQKPAGHAALIWTERIGRLVLVLAYFVSVTYYLMLLSTFVLKAMNVADAELARWMTTAILAGIGGFGYWRGLHGIQRMETVAVSLNLAVIAGLLAGLVWYNGHAVLSGNWHLATGKTAMNLGDMRVILGLLIVVQGFETSRFMGEEYKPEVRIRAMRWAQLTATLIYVVFFALVTLLFRNGVHECGVAAVIDMVRPVTLVLPILLIAGAIASQFSASIADSIGAAGLLEETSRGRLTLQQAYPIITGIAILLVWTTNVFGIINLASRAFALFYAVQCLSALVVLRDLPRDWKRHGQAVLFALLGLLCVIVVVFAIPSGG